MHHEYAVQIIQPLAVRRYLGLADAAETRHILARNLWRGDPLFGPAPLGRFLQQAFVADPRSGRTVSGSEVRPSGARWPQSGGILFPQVGRGMLRRPFQRHFAGLLRRSRRYTPRPPPEKKYWWPVPRKGAADAQAFRLFDQFERIAWHWAEINRVILDELSKLPEQRKAFARLEDLRSSPESTEGAFTLS